MPNSRFLELFSKKATAEPEIKAGDESITYDPNDIEQVVGLLLQRYFQELGTVLTERDIIYLKPAPNTGNFADFILLVEVNGQETLVRGYSRLKNGMIPCATVFYPTHLWEILYTCSYPMTRDYPETYNYFVNLFNGYRAKTPQDIEDLAEYLQASFPDSWGKIDLNKLKTLLDVLPSKGGGKTFSVGEHGQ